jgi:hypothetical protein
VLGFKPAAALFPTLPPVVPPVRHAGARGYHCDWQAVWDVEGKRLLDLGDPFASEAEWKQCARTDWIARALAIV